MMIESSDFIIHFSLLIPRQSDKAFYHIHFISYHIHCFFQFKNYPPFTATRPRGKVPVRSISSGETKQRFQIKRITDNSRTCPHRVIGITILFDMCRHHQDRFSKIHRFTDRFKPCRTCISPATSHSVEKLDIINLIKTERLINLCHFLRIRFIPKEFQRYLRMTNVKLLHTIGKPEFTIYP